MPTRCSTLNVRTTQDSDNPRQRVSARSVRERAQRLDSEYYLKLLLDEGRSQMFSVQISSLIKGLAPSRPQTNDSGIGGSILIPSRNSEVSLRIMANNARCEYTRRAQIRRIRSSTVGSCKLQRLQMVRSFLCTDISQVHNFSVVRAACPVCADRIAIWILNGFSKRLVCPIISFRLCGT